MTAGGSRVLIVIALTSALGGLAWYLKNNLSLPQLVEQEQRLRESIALRPWRAFASGLAIYAIVSLVPGTSGKSIIFGWLFGFWRAVPLILTGLTIAAISTFYFSRYGFRRWIESHYGGFLAGLNRHLQKEGAFYLLTLRMAHFPYSIINLASGASRVSLSTFCWTTALGLLPGTMIFAFVGVRLPSLDELARQGAKSLIDGPLLAAMALSALFPWVFRLALRRLGILQRPGSDGTIDPLPPEPPSQ